MLRKILKVLAVVFGLSAVVGAVFLVNLVWFRPWSLNLYYEKVFVRFALQNPEMLSSIGLLEQFGYRAHNGHLDDASLEHDQAMMALAREALTDLRAYDLAAQSPSQQLSTRILAWYLENEIAGQEFSFHNYPVNQLHGVQSSQPEFMVDIHQIPDRKGAEHYLARLGEWGRKFDQVIDGLRYREDRGITPPRFVLERVLTEMRAFIDVPVEENVLYTSFAERVEALENLSDETKMALRSECGEAITSTVYPAYNRLIEACEGLGSRASSDDGVWKFPEGDAFYAHVLHTYTTTTLSPDEVHDLGRREVARIEAEIRRILDAQGHLGKTPGEWLQVLSEDPQFLPYAETEAGRVAALDQYSKILDESFARSQTLFKRMPKASLEVRPVPDFKEDTSPAAYYRRPAMDASRPGVFYVNLGKLAETTSFSMKTLAYHEGIPGHHFQIAIAQELEGLPMFRSLLPFTAYIEGWALYAEWLAHEMGLYEGDPYGNLGRLQMEMLRAVRLVVDTGIHAKHWTREAAIAYMLEKTGQDGTIEIERYIVNPGQACAYMVGMLKIRALRDHAEEALGADFSLPAFHDVVLRNGALPLDILEDLVEQWIADVKTG